MDALTLFLVFRNGIGNVVGQNLTHMVRVIFGFTNERGDMLIVYRVVDDIAVSAWLDYTPVL
jgi:hypothetical protein